MRRFRWTLVASLFLGLGMGGYLYLGPMALPRQATQVHDFFPSPNKMPYSSKGPRRPMLMVTPNMALPVFSIALSGDGKWLAAASRDRFAHVWNLTEGGETPGFEAELGAIRAVALSRDGRWLAAADENVVRLWDFAGGSEAAVFKGHKKAVEFVAISADGSRLATYAGDGARLWDKSADKAVYVFRHFYRDKEFRIRAVALSAHGKWVVTGGDDRIARLWSADSGEEIRTFSGHTDPIRAVALSSDGKHLFTASDDETACMWDLADGTLIRSFFHDDNKVIALDVSKDGQLLATGGEDRTAILWDLTTYKKLHTLRGHSTPVRAVVLTADGRRLFTGGGGENDAIALWDTASGDKLCDLISFKFHAGGSDRGWAVRDDRDSSYDSSHQGNVFGLNWMVGGNFIPLAKLRDKYTPGLLAKRLAGK